MDSNKSFEVVTTPAIPALFGRTAEKAAFDITGYSAPLPLAEPSRAQVVLAGYSGDTSYTKNPHTTSRVVRNLLSDPALVANVKALCGDGLRLWRSAFFSKRAGTTEIGWHHDKHFYSGDGDDIRLDEIRSHFSVLFGLTEITQTTGMLEVLPGSHLPNSALPRDLRPYHKRSTSEHIQRDLPKSILTEARAVPIPRGSFVIFHSAIFHRSLAHSNGPPRLALAIRLVRDELEIPTPLALTEYVTLFPPPQ